METIFSYVEVQMIIVSITIVISLCLFLIFKKKWEKPKECITCTRNKSFHLIYISGYFILISILGFVYMIVNTNQYKYIYEYFSFASVIVSIILAVLTIVYSYYINSNSTKQVEKLDISSSNITEASKSVLKSSSLISENSTKLSNHLGQILTLLEDVRRTAEGARNEAVKAKESTEKYFELYGKREEINNSNSGDVEQNEGREFVNKFINTTSLIGQYLFLAFKYSYEQKKVFRANDIYENTEDYIYGFIVATSCTGIIQYEVKDKIYNIQDIDSNIITLIEPHFEKRLSEEKDVNIKLRIENQIEKIKTYFGVS